MVGIYSPYPWFSTIFFVKLQLTLNYHSVSIKIGLKVPIQDFKSVTWSIELHAQSKEEIEDKKVRVSGNKKSCFLETIKTNKI